MQTFVVFDTTGIHYMDKQGTTKAGRISPDLIGFTALSKYISKKKYYYLLWFLISIVLLVILKVWGLLLVIPLLFSIPSSKLKVNYELDKEAVTKWNDFIDSLRCQCAATNLWIETNTTENTNVKYHAGAQHSISREMLPFIVVESNTNSSLKFNVRFNVRTLLFKTPSRSVLFIPDGIIVQQFESIITTYSYDDFCFNSTTTRFVENGSVSPNAEIVDYTWEYVNLNGMPDRRFKDNRKYPVCLYGLLMIIGDKIDLRILTSGNDVAGKIETILRNRKEYIARLTKQVH